MKKILSIIACLALVMVGGLAFSACGETKKTTTEVSNFNELKLAVEKGGSVKLKDHITLESTLTTTKNVDLNLNGYKIDEDYTWNTSNESKAITMFQINGGTLTISGNGTVESDDLYLFNVGRSVTPGITTGNLEIFNGTFKGTGTNKTLVQVAKGKAEISGGYYELAQADAKYMLNLIDESGLANTAEIVITGGRFKGFNPSAVTCEPANGKTSFVADGYEARAGKGENENVYTVAETPTLVQDFASLQTAVANGGQIRLEASFAVTGTLKVNKTVVLDLNGHKITETGLFHFTEQGASTNVFALFTVDGGSLTVTDSSLGEVGGIETTDLYVFNIVNAGVLTIENGSFKITGTEAEKAVDTIVQVVSGSAYIKGGKFEIALENKTYLLNLLDDGARESACAIEVTGGTFVGYDPAEISSEPEELEITTFVVDGYVSNEDAGSWTVSAEE